MIVIEVENKQQETAFLSVAETLYKSDKNWIKPLDKDILDVFNPKKNRTFKHGEAKRWILKDENNVLIGRIAAFTNDKMYGKMEQKTGGIGFFECVDKQQAANLLFDTAKNWLQSKNIEAMDGPNNFGEKDKWWGLLVDGYHPPTYCMNYNFPYYKNLFENYGFQVYYNQFVYAKSIEKGFQKPKRIVEKWEKLNDKENFVFEHIVGNNLDKYADDFVTVYNAAWANNHHGFKPMDRRQGQKIMKSLKPIMDKEIMWFGYYKDKPVAMFIAIPDINSIIKHLNGKLNLWGKLKFLYYQKFAKIDRAVAIVFGIAPEFQGKGVDGAIAYKAQETYSKSQYNILELNWIGDFNPKMINMVINLDVEVYRTYTNYRYLFDRNKPFNRHPILK